MATQGTVIYASPTLSGNKPLVASAQYTTFAMQRTSGEWPALRYRVVKAYITCTIANDGEDAVTVRADGRHLWRVLDNLLNNISKYAQPDTRVYLDLAETQECARITFRNISRSPLHISSEELMERFVRGDSSRNTEGSGLGLSIARSLTELQHGTFGLRIDGELFKVELTLPICNGIAAENGEAAE